MSTGLVVVDVTVFLAAALQAATGIGFGVLAGPIMLVVLDDRNAIQVSVALSLLIAFILVPTVRREIDKGVLTDLIVGSMIGIPVGLLLYVVIGMAWLKLLAGLMVLCAVAAVAGGGGTPERKPRQMPGRMEKLVLGIASGTMSGALAMPGPIPAAWMAARSYGKNATRATVLALFIFSYVVVFALQIGFVGVTSSTLIVMAQAMPFTLAGVAAGHWASRRLTARQFKWLLGVILVATGSALLLSAAMNIT